MKESYVLFVLLLIACIFLPGKWAFVALVGFIGLHLVAGFVHPPAFDTISRILGVYLMLIVLVEAAHAGTAIRYGIPIKGFNVNLIGFDEGTMFGPSGFVELYIDKEAVDASPELQSNLSWVAAAGSIVLVIFGALYFIIRTTTQFPAIIASVMFLRHQAPFLVSDQSMMVEAGWMSPAFAYGILIVGLIVLGIAAANAGKKKPKPGESG